MFLNMIGILIIFIENVISVTLLLGWRNLDILNHKKTFKSNKEKVVFDDSECVISFTLLSRCLEHLALNISLVPLCTEWLDRQ